MMESKISRREVLKGSLTLSGVGLVPTQACDDRKQEGGDLPKLYRLEDGKEVTWEQQEGGKEYIILKFEKGRLGEIERYRVADMADPFDRSREEPPGMHPIHTDETGSVLLYSSGPFVMKMSIESPWKFQVKEDATPA